MKAKPLIATAILVVSFGSTQAEIVRGAPSCSNWLKERQEEGVGQVVYRAWLLGFLSGLSWLADKDAMGGTDNESMSLWIDNYCRANPLKKVDAEAVGTLFTELTRKQPR